MSNDKLYIIVILGMIGFFIYWYQTRLDDPPECRRCKKSDKRNRRNRSRNSKDRDRYEVAVKETENRTLRPSIKKSRKPPTISVRFKEDADNDSDISLDSLDSSDKVGSSEGLDDDDTQSCDTLDI